jgi:hypothetical protein
VIDLLKNYFDIIPDDNARKRREKIGGKILILDRALELGQQDLLYAAPA